MRYAIVDHSTLSAVDRIMGRIPVENRYILDADISALEVLLNGILFYDGVLAIDDYIEPHKDERKNSFGFIQFLKKEDIDIRAGDSFAREIANGLRIKIRESFIDDGELRKFIDLLRMNMVFTWRMRSSIFWLTASLLGEPNTPEIHRYSRLWESISAEIVYGKVTEERVETWKMEADVRDLAQDNGYEVSEQVRDFVAALGWLTYRTAFYTAAAAALGCDALLHPIRSSFQIEFLSKHFGLHQNTYSQLVGYLNGNIRESVKLIRKASDPFVGSWDIPLMSVYLISQVGNPSLLIEEALRLRNFETFVSIRRLFIELEEIERRIK